MYKTLAPCCIGHQVPLDIVAPIAEKYGFEGVWLELENDCKMPIGETKALLEKHHLRAAGFALPVEFRNDEATYRNELNKLDEYAKYAEACGITRCITWIFPFSETLSYEENFELHCTRLREVSLLLLKYGIRLGLEFLGPPKLRRGVRYEFIHTLEQMLELCEAIACENIGLLLDVWHWDMAGQTYQDFTKIKDESMIICAHIMDAPEGVDREEQEDLIRELPGATGVLRIEEFFRGLREMNYSGPVLAEPFVKELGEMKFEEAVAIVSEAMNSVWGE